MSGKAILGVIPVFVVGVILFLSTTPDQKKSFWDAAKQICNLQNTVVISVTDSFIASVNDEKAREQLLKLKSIGQVSLSVSEHAELLENLYEKKIIKLNQACVIVGVT